MVTDTVQLIIWAVVGFLITWGDFLAVVGFRDAWDKTKKRRYKAAEISTLVIGVLWVMIWVSAVVVNLIQILGDPSWLTIR